MRRSLLRRSFWVVLVLVLGASDSARASLTASTTFNPGSAGSLCGIGSDPTGDVWVYACSGADLQRYSPAGTFVSSVARPGESANDVDVELTPKQLTLGATSVPGGSLLFVNGETGVAEIYAVDRFAGTVVATLATAFGVSHVVGGAYHPGRKTLFLVQDLVPGAADENRIAEINTVTGAVVNTFQITATFAVNFGDVDVCASTGNLLVASSNETRLAEYAPTGTFVQYHDLPASVASLSGIGIEDETGDIWVSGTGGEVWRLEGSACPPAPEIPALPTNALLALGALLAGVGLGALALRRS